ncbi:Uncharacterized protein FWK35_00000820 [Aphis craccivora]|uniref:Uncharacterized protein n=2 Tax=Aphis craccivora TaxID=307492 RepID=A0A6G0ZJI1_APHCR|nr:Uncharacterized protein FWK35_00000820 [Aphis craccivora]
MLMFHDSERSEMLQFQTMGVVSDVKVNILGALYRLKVNIFQQFSKKSRKTKKKNDGKREFLRKTSFRPNRFFFGCNSKTNHCKYLKFSPNVYVSVIYIQLNFQKNLTFFDVDKKILDDQKVPYDSNFYEICRKRDNLQAIKIQTTFFTNHWKLYPRPTNHLRSETI